MSLHRFTRRGLLRTAGAGAGALALGPGRFRGVSAQATPTTPLPQSGPVDVVIWSYRPDIVQDNLKIWAQLNGQPDAQFADIPGAYDYQNVIAAKFLGGEHVDMCYSHADYVNRWHKAGWLRDDLDQIPWVQELKPKLQPWGIENMSTYDGKLVGLPYWAGTKVYVYNDLHFQQAGITAPPQTWEEFENQCKQLQGAGIKNPYVPGWTKDFGGIGWSMYIESYSEGDYIFDDKYNLTVTGGDTPFSTMLQRWKRFYDSGIVPPDAFTIADPVVRFATGDHSFVLNDDYSQKRMNDPSVSKVAGHAKNMINPGTTHETTPISPMYVFGKNTDTPPEVQNDLAHYFGGQYTDGVYHVALRWVLEEGLGTVNTEVMAMPDVRASFAKWRDVDLYAQQMALGKPRNVAKQLWYPEWEAQTLGMLQEFIIGKQQLGDVLKGMQDTLDAAKKLYPTF